MVTADEIAKVPLFAGLSAADRERLSRSAADITLGTGEYAVNEGDERALFAVLEGKIEVVKRVDGIERVLGERSPGSIFGEVPITLGAPFPSGFRAAEPSRIMRVEPQGYYAVAATAPDVAVKVGALARERIGGLQGLAAEAPSRAPSYWGIATTPPARSCAASWTATRSSSSGSRRMRPTPPRGWGSAAAITTAISLRFASRTGRRSSARGFARSPSSSAFRPIPPPVSTTRSSSVPDRRAWPPLCTELRRGSEPS